MADSSVDAKSSQIFDFPQACNPMTCAETPPTVPAPQNQLPGRLPRAVLGSSRRCLSRVIHRFKASPYLGVELGSTPQDKAGLDPPAFEAGFSDTILSVNLVHHDDASTPVTRFFDSFRRHQDMSGDEVACSCAVQPLPSCHCQRTSKRLSLATQLQTRHMQMIVIGSGVGTGLFITSGLALAESGPASTLIAFALMGLTLYCACSSLAELAVAFPTPGSFVVYAGRFIDPAWGFAIGWNYFFSWALNLPLALTAAYSTIKYWTRAEGVGPVVWTSIFLLFLVTVNVAGVRAFGETEYIFSFIKVVALCGWTILGVVIDAGGVPHRPARGFDSWRNPGAFINGCYGLSFAFQIAAFAFSGTELVGICAAEADSPQRSVPASTKRVFWIWRIVVIYLVTILVLGLLIAPSGESFGLYPSAFVIAVSQAGISVIPSLMNAVVLVALISSGNVALYGASRVLCALSAQGHAPKIFSYVDRSRRPLVAIIASSAFGLFALGTTTDAGEFYLAFNWMYALCGFATIFIYGSICFAHLRFRKAWKVQGHTVEELPFRSDIGVAGSWIGLTMVILILANLTWQAAYPLGWTGDFSANVFFMQYLSVVIISATYVLFKILKRTKFQRAKSMDVDSDRREASSLFNKESSLVDRVKKRRCPAEPSIIGSLPDHDPELYTFRDELPTSPPTTQPHFKSKKIVAPRRILSLIFAPQNDGSLA